MNFLSWDNLTPEQKDLLRIRGISKELFEDELSQDEQTLVLLPGVSDSDITKIKEGTYEDPSTFSQPWVPTKLNIFDSKNTAPKPTVLKGIRHWSDLTYPERSLLKARHITEKVFNDWLSPADQDKVLDEKTNKVELKSIYDDYDIDIMSIYQHKYSDTFAFSVFDKEGTNKSNSGIFDDSGREVSVGSSWDKEEDKILDKINEDLFGIKKQVETLPIAPRPEFPAKKREDDKAKKYEMENSFVIMDTEWGPNNTVLQISARHVKWNKEAKAYITVGKEFNQHYPIPKGMEGETKQWLIEKGLDEPDSPSEGKIWEEHGIWSNKARIRRGILSPNAPVFNEGEKKKFLKFVRKYSSSPKVLAYNGSGLGGLNNSDFATVFEFGRTKEGLPTTKEVVSGVSLLDPFPGMQAVTNTVLQSMRRQQNSNVGYAPLEGKGVFTLGSMYERFVGKPFIADPSKRITKHLVADKGEDFDTLQDKYKVYKAGTRLKLPIFEKFKEWKAKSNDTRNSIIEEGAFQGQAHDARFDTQMLTELMTAFRYAGGHFNLLTRLLEQGIAYTYDNVSHTIDPKGELSPWSLDFWKLPLKPNELRALVPDISTEQFVSLADWGYNTLKLKKHVTEASVNIPLTEKPTVTNLLRFESLMQSSKQFSKMEWAAMKEEEKIKFQQELEAKKERFKKKLNLDLPSWWDKILRRFDGMSGVSQAGVNYLLNYLNDVLGPSLTNTNPLDVFLNEMSPSAGASPLKSRERTMFDAHLRGLELDPSYRTDPSMLDDVLKEYFEAALTKYMEGSASKSKGAHTTNYIDEMVKAGVDPLATKDALRFTVEYEKQRRAYEEAKKNQNKPQPKPPLPGLPPLPTPPKPVKLPKLGKNAVSALVNMGYSDFQNVMRDNAQREEFFRLVGIPENAPRDVRKGMMDTLFTNAFNSMEAKVLKDQDTAGGYFNFASANNLRGMSPQKRFQEIDAYKAKTSSDNSLILSAKKTLAHKIREATLSGETGLMARLSLLNTKTDEAPYGYFREIDYNAGFDKETLQPKGFIDTPLDRPLTKGDVHLQLKGYSEEAQNRTEYRRAQRRSARSLFYRNEIQDNLDNILHARSKEERNTAINNIQGYQRAGIELMTKALGPAVNYISEALVSVGQGLQTFREKLGEYASSTWDVASSFLPRNVYRAGSRWIQSEKDFVKSANIQKEERLKIGGNFLSSVGTGAMQGALTGAAIGSAMPGVGNVVGGAAGALIGGGMSMLPAGIQAHFGLKTAGMESVGAFIRGQVGMWAGLIELLKGPVDLLRGSFLRLWAGLGRFWDFFKKGLDMMTRMGIPYTTMTGMGYSDMFKSYHADVILRQGKGTSMSANNAWATEGQGLYSIGNFDRNKLVAAAITGNFSNLYGGLGSDPVKGRDASITSIVSQINNAGSEGEKQRLMYFANVMGLTREVEQMLQFQRSGVVSRGASWGDIKNSKFGMFVERPTDREGAKWNVTSTQWGLVKEQAGYSWMRAAQRMWDFFGKDVLNVLNKLGHAIATGNFRNIGKYFAEAIKDLKPIFMKVWDAIKEAWEGIKDEFGGNPLSAIWDKFKQGFAAAMLKLLPILSSIFAGVAGFLQNMFLKVIDTIGPFIDNLSYLAFNPEALLPQNWGKVPLIKNLKKEQEEKGEALFNHGGGYLKNMYGDTLWDMDNGLTKLLPKDAQKHVMDWMSKGDGQKYYVGAGMISGKHFQLTPEQAAALKKEAEASGLGDDYMRLFNKGVGNALMLTALDRFVGKDEGVHKEVFGTLGALSDKQQSELYRLLPSAKDIIQGWGLKEAHKPLTGLVQKGHEAVKETWDYLGTDLEKFLVEVIELLKKMATGTAETAMSTSIVASAMQAKEAVSKMILEIVDGKTGEIKEQWLHRSNEASEVVTKQMILSNASAVN